MLFNKEDMHDHCEKSELKDSNLDVNLSQSDNNFFGPVLPPHLLKKDHVENKYKEKIYGPTIPDYLRKNVEELDKITVSCLPVKNSVSIGPVLPEHLNGHQSVLEYGSMDEDDNFGPSTDLMASGDVSSSYKIINMQISSKKTSEDSPVKRETWMTELPEKRKANFGLLPRHFKSQVPTDKDNDDSVWTDTPADKERKKTSKKDHTEVLKMKRIQERDKQMEKLAKKAAKKLKKKKSLLEIHLKNKKKKKEKEAKKLQDEGKTVPERRPFDRNIDLQVRKFDENQRKAILNKSHFLNDRFAPGQSKFL